MLYNQFDWFIEIKLLNYLLTQKNLLVYIMLQRPFPSKRGNEKCDNRCNSLLVNSSCSAKYNINLAPAKN